MNNPSNTRFWLNSSKPQKVRIVVPHFHSRCHNIVEYNRLAALIAASVYADGFKEQEFIHETKAIVARLRTVVSIQQLSLADVDVVTLLNLTNQHLANLKKSVTLISLTGRIDVQAYTDSVCITFNDCCSLENLHERTTTDTTHSRHYA